MKKKHTREPQKEQDFINTNECSSSLTPFEDWQREIELGIKKLNQWSDKAFEEYWAKKEG